MSMNEAMTEVYTAEIKMLQAKQKVSDLLLTQRDEQILNLQQEIGKLKQMLESKQRLQNFLIKNENDIVCLNIIGLCHFSKKEIIEAEKIFLKTLKINNKDLSILNSIGRLYHEIRDTKKAEKLNNHTINHQILGRLSPIVIWSISTSIAALLSLTTYTMLENERQLRMRVEEQIELERKEAVAALVSA